MDSDEGTKLQIKLFIVYYLYNKIPLRNNPFTRKLCFTKTHVVIRKNKGDLGNYGRCHKIFIDLNIITTSSAD